MWCSRSMLCIHAADPHRPTRGGSCTCLSYLVHGTSRNMQCASATRRLVVQATTFASNGASAVHCTECVRRKDDRPPEHQENVPVATSATSKQPRAKSANTAPASRPPLAPQGTARAASANAAPVTIKQGVRALRANATGQGQCCHCSAGSVLLARGLCTYLCEHTRLCHAMRKCRWSVDWLAWCSCVLLCGAMRMI